MNWSFIFTRTFSEMIGATAVFYILGAQGLNIHFGYTGLLNFGQAGFMLIGAYSVAICAAPETSGGQGWPLWVGVLVAIVATVVFAALLGIPTLRLRGDYLAIVTIAAAEILRIIARSEATEGFSGGNSGINGFARGFYEANPFVNGKRYEFGPFSYLGKDLWVMVVGWTVVAIAALLTFLLMRSPWGRVLRSIRENEDAVRALGKNVFAYKMQSLVLGALMGAAGGIVIALQQNLATPDDFGTKATFTAYTALILGGAARVFGPIVGGMIFYGFFTFMQVGASQAVAADLIPRSVMDDIQAGIVPFIMLGIALMLLVVFRPQGIFGSRREIELDVR